MEDNTLQFDLLWKRAIEYGKTNIELIKLKFLDKFLAVFSSLIPPIIVFLLAGSFYFFLNLALALWLGDLLGNAYYGYLIVAGFYGFLAIIVHLFLQKPIKKRISDFIIKQVLK